MVLNILFTVVLLFCMFVFYFVYSAFLNCFVYCFPLYTAVSFPFFVKVYRPLPSVGNPIAVNKYHIIN